MLTHFNYFVKYPLFLRCLMASNIRIEAAIAAKQFEHRIMSAMPCGILFYLRLTDLDFLAPLYNTVPGILVMTASLIIYAAAWFLGKRITDISV